MRDALQCLTDKDANETGCRSVIVFIQISRQSPDHNGVGDEDVPHMSVKDQVFQHKPVKYLHISTQLQNLTGVQLGFDVLQVKTTHHTSNKALKREYEMVAASVGDIFTS